MSGRSLWLVSVGLAPTLCPLWGKKSSCHGGFLPGRGAMDLGSKLEWVSPKAGAGGEQGSLQGPQPTGDMGRRGQGWGAPSAVSQKARKRHADPAPGHGGPGSRPDADEQSRTARPRARRVPRLPGDEGLGRGGPLQHPECRCLRIGAPLDLCPTPRLAPVGTALLSPRAVELALTPGGPTAPALASAPLSSCGLGLRVRSRSISCPVLLVPCCFPSCPERPSRAQTRSFSSRAHCPLPHSAWVPTARLRSLASPPNA